MRVEKLSTVDAFVAWDLDCDGPFAGVVRCAPKILVDGATLLARSTTYAFAVFGVRASGASAGVNASPEDRDAAVAAFVSEMEPHVEAGRLVLSAGTGVGDGAALGPLVPAGLPHRPEDAALVASGAVSVADALTEGGLGDREAVVVGDGPVAEAARGALVEAGATVIGGDLGTAAAVAFVAGRAGFVDHEVAATVGSPVVVPLTPVPLTAKAYATLSRAGVVYFPDFVALAAPLLAAFDADAPLDPLARVRLAAEGLASEGPDSWRVAVAAAEDFLATWQDKAPFGRPLA
ncbi:MAG: hypothetical protein ACT4PW_07405 [Acidimicrobiia bacterium]